MLEIVLLVVVVVQQRCKECLAVSCFVGSVDVEDFQRVFAVDEDVQLGEASFGVGGLLEDLAAVGERVGEQDGASRSSSCCSRPEAVARPVFRPGRDVGGRAVSFLEGDDVGRWLQGADVTQKLMPL